MNNSPALPKKPKYFWDGYCWGINSEHGQVAGRTLDQAQKTADLIASGRVSFDGDGIGIRDNRTTGEIVMSIVDSLGNILIDRRD